jgi:hypothetical protein
VYERYRSYYTKFGGENVMNIAKDVAEEFFDFSSTIVTDDKKSKKK